MEPDRWQRLWTIFHGALERPGGEERTAFLDEACGDDAALRAEVDALLEAHDGPDHAPLAPSLRLPTADLAELAPGDRIGAYRIERRIAVGGMGEVYEATQEAPVRRRVAVKRIKLGMDTREVVRRFEAERQALARMDHSSIARVFDAGATAEGRPFFVMELVDGPPLPDYCDRERLPLARRVELFVAVCRAVHHAHQKGVIHRDLKASNVLVATEEGGPLPKVIDFGVARAVDPQGEGGTLFTRLGQLVGTPETMSPEQAAMSADLDTRTDVYSLGALLYELLAGASPFPHGDTSFTEILRRIREDEPPPPALRLAGLGDVAREIAARRSTSPERLRHDLGGELAWIVARAMAKERDRRYGSAAELADDLERYLADRPVAAGPPSRFYRLRKLVRRHRLATAALTALTLALVGFGAAMTVQSRRLARALEQREKEQATATRVSEFLAELLEQSDPAIARGSEPTVRQVLDRGAEKIARDLADQPEIQVRLLETLGRVYLGLGHFDEADRAVSQALAIRRRLEGDASLGVAADLQRLSELDFERARYDSARARVDEALRLRRRLLGDDDPAVAESLDVAALLLRQADDLDGAERLHRQALEIRQRRLDPEDPALGESWNYLGIVRRWRGDLAGAEAAYRQALAIWRAAFGDDHPRVAMAMNNLALVVHLRGDYAAARRLFEELLPLRRRILGGEHPDLVFTLANYAKLLHDARDLDAAAAVYAEALALGRKTLGETHPQVAVVMADYGSVLAKLGRLDEALALEERALAARRATFGDEHPAVAASLGYLAEVRAARGERAAADRLYGEATAMLRRVAGDDPRTAEALAAHGRFVLAHGDLDRAEALLRSALSLQQARLPVGDRRIARTESALGECLGRLGRTDEAQRLLESAVAALASPENPDTADARGRLAALRATRQKGG